MTNRISKARKRKTKTTGKPNAKRPRGSMGVSHADSPNETANEELVEEEEDEEEKERKYLVSTIVQQVSFSPKCNN